MLYSDYNIYLCKWNANGENRQKLEEFAFHRPISLMLKISKMFANLFLKQLKPLMSDRKIIRKQQFDFPNQ